VFEVWSRYLQPFLRYDDLKFLGLCQTVSDTDFRHFSQIRQKLAVPVFVAKPVGINVSLGEEYRRIAIFSPWRGDYSKM
jgi:hypothetical protein